MKKILVTGAIASGKSEICRYLHSKGIPVYDSDSRAKALYEKIPGLKSRVEDAIGADFGQIAIIFRDESKRLAVEELVHPLVRKDFEEWAEGINAAVVVFESALALGSVCFEGLFDTVIIVKAPLEMRIERNNKVLERNHTQSFDESKADFIILNDSDIESLHEKIDRIILNQV